MSEQRGTSRRLVAALAAALVLGACSTGASAGEEGAASTARPAATSRPGVTAQPADATSGATAGGTAEGTDAPDEAAVRAPVLVLRPGDGAGAVEPDAAVSVRVSNGELDDVVLLDESGRRVPGTRSEDGRRWRVEGPLALGTSYALRATARGDDGSRAYQRVAFSTLTTDELLTTSISPLDGQTVGVGMPLVVRLSHEVENRAEVQRALRVTTEPAVEGSWSWVSDDELQYRPKDFWPSGTTVHLDVGLTGVDAGGGVWGDETRTVAFDVGRRMVSVVDVDALTMTVRQDGEVVRTMPVTTGKAGYRTRGGVKVISEKYESKIMDAATGGVSEDDPEYYRLEVPYALRVTWSGEFLHAAPWSTGSQGSANVSHGCVGMSLADGRWFFEQSQVGDVVEVVGSDRALEPGNGYTAWNVPWKEWVAGSAV